MLVDLVLVIDGTGTARHSDIVVGCRTVRFGVEVNAASVICVSNRPRSMICAAAQS